MESIFRVRSLSLDIRDMSLDNHSDYFLVYDPDVSFAQWGCILVSTGI